MDDKVNGAPEQASPEMPMEPAPPEEVCSKKVYDELYDRYRRLQAEFDNFRKRTEREKQELKVFGSERLLQDLLPVMDSLELALRHARETETPPALTEGVSLVQKQFAAVLERHGLTGIEALGTPFDPRYHEALIHLDSPDHDDNTVIEEHQKGYLLGNRTLRPSRVSVSRKVPPDAGDTLV
jgi:molecular chaperone GrpE